MTLISKIQETKQHNNENMLCPINNFPTEIVLYALSFLKKSEVYKAAATDSRWREIVQLRLEIESSKHCYKLVYKQFFRAINMTDNQTRDKYVELEGLLYENMRGRRYCRSDSGTLESCQTREGLVRWSDRFVQLMGPFHADRIKGFFTSLLLRIKNVPSLEIDDRMPLDTLTLIHRNPPIRQRFFSSTQQNCIEELAYRLVEHSEAQRRVGNNQQKLNSERCELIVKIIEETNDVQQSMRLPIWVACRNLTALAEEHFITGQELCTLIKEMTPSLSVEKQKKAYTQLAALISRELQRMELPSIDLLSCDMSEQIWRERALYALSSLPMDQCTILYEAMLQQKVDSPVLCHDFLKEMVSRCETFQHDIDLQCDCY